MGDGAVAIATFVKTPSHSPVKTRLAKTIGEEKATAVFHHLLNITKNVLSDFKNQCSDVHMYWAVAEESCLKAPLWNDFPTLWQGEGALGKKLFNVQEQLFQKHQSIIFIGADAPFINVSLLQEAMSILNVKHSSDDTDKFVLGPSLDGGFYLYGANRKKSFEQWEQITYSSENTLKELIENFNITKEKHLLQELYDIDVISDLEMAYRDLLARESIRCEINLQTFLNWLTQNLY